MGYDEERLNQTKGSDLFNGGYENAGNGGACHEASRSLPTTVPQW